MTQEKKRKLSWERDDFERRLGFNGGRYMKVGALSSGVVAGFFSVVFYATLLYVPSCAFRSALMERGWTPYAVVFLGFWTFFILWIKTRKIKLQRQALAASILPDDPEFVLTVKTVDAVALKIAEIADNPKSFLLYRRVLQTLSNLRNLGRVSDVDALFRSQAEQDDNTTESSYALVGGFLWAIPILGFIGTVVGLSSAIGNFTGVLTSSSDVSELTPALKEVTAGLSTAFETTLVALCVALCLQLYSTFVRKSEEEFLDDCAEFCAVNIVAKLRLEKDARNSSDDDPDDDPDDE